MVSLYRAWAAWAGRGPGGGPGGPGAPDALVQAGGVRFAAHARLLAAHSGYFKSALARPWAPATFPGEPEEPRLEEESVLYVPNISAQQFWPLLAYMYTGFLELTPENIYQVLLATHLLHMPRALELCRSFLAGGAPPPAPATTVVKPIASRKLPPFLAAAPFQPLYPEPSLAFLRAQHETPFRPVDPSGVQTVVPGGGIEEENAEVDVVSQIQTDDRAAKDEARAPDLTPPTTSKRDDALRSSARESGPQSTTKTRGHSAVNLIKNRKIKSAAKQQQSTVAKKAELLKAAAEPAAAKAQNPPRPDDKVVVDVACCDGPVRFHRVLNSAFESDGAEARGTADDSGDSDDSYVEIEEDSRSRSEAPYDNCNAFSKSLQKQMSEDIRTMGAAHAESREEGAADEASNSEGSSKQEAIYTCVYCNHTFKSQYCYQKHARRHINPVSIDQGPLETTAGSECCKERRLGRVPAPRREVRLLDMNVQYYPCKTCGSKFPSYYFVHKHRKMCHKEELDGETDRRKEQDGGASGKTDQTPP